MLKQVNVPFDREPVDPEIVSEALEAHFRPDAAGEKRNKINKAAAAPDVRELEDVLEENAVDIISKRVYGAFKVFNCSRIGAVNHEVGQVVFHKAPASVTGNFFH